MSELVDNRDVFEFSFNFRIRGTEEQVRAARSKIQIFIENCTWAVDLDAKPGTSFTMSSPIRKTNECPL